MSHHLLPSMSMLVFAAGLAGFAPSRYREWKLTGVLRLRTTTWRRPAAVYPWFAFMAVLELASLLLAVKYLLFGFHGKLV